MAYKKRVVFQPSEKKPVLGARALEPVPDDETIRVTITLRRATEPTDAAKGGILPRMSQEQFAKSFGAQPEDIAKVEAFARAFGLTVVESSVAKRRVVIEGPADAMKKAFDTNLERFSDESGITFRARTGSLSVPVELESVITGILGLDTRPIAVPHFRVGPAVSRGAFRPAATTGTFTAPQIATAYQFPQDLNGHGQTIALIELGGGYNTADLKNYFTGLNIPMPQVTAVSVDGAKNSPGDTADFEVMLDIEVAGAVAPGANIAVYFAPNTTRGFVDAVLDAVHDTKNNPSVISISWGAVESSWTEQARTAMNDALQDAAILGVTITVASGDHGSSEGQSDQGLHVDFPASSPFALGCGGTTLSTVGSNIASEVVWNEQVSRQGATGGGISSAFARPDYQKNVKVPKHPQSSFVGRGVPDVAGNANPLTGYQVHLNGRNMVLGGTSAVAPLWAALIAMINQKLGKRVGFLNQLLYSTGVSGFRDITGGSNDDSGLGHYSAGPGWDPCTGLGCPNGVGLLKILQSGGVGTTPKPIPQPVPTKPGSIWDFPPSNWSPPRPVPKPTPTPPVTPPTPTPPARPPTTPPVTGGSIWDF